MIEHERSYTFSLETARRFVDHYGTEGKPRLITDYYLDKGLRLREVDDRFILTHKEGKKSDGYRFEREEDVNKGVADILKSKSVMTVQKSRVDLAVHGDKNCYNVTMDFVELPMKLAILEVEAMDEAVYPIPADIGEKLFGVNLRECPLCSWNLFNRKIGICGAPSSGKSELAKGLSHTLNTQYGANTFHVVEFATSFIQKYKKTPSFHDHFFIWYGQHAREDAAQSANIVISDCPTFLSYIYMKMLNKFVFSEETALYYSKVYKRVLFDLNLYTDMIFMELIEFKDNSIRFHNLEESKEIQRRILFFLKEHNIPYVRTNYRESDRLLADLFYLNDFR